MNLRKSDIYRPITLNTWHKVRIIRNGLESSLQLDSDPYISGRSPAPMTSLNLGEPLMVGGFRYRLLSGNNHNIFSTENFCFILEVICHQKSS